MADDVGEGIFGIAKVGADDAGADSVGAGGRRAKSRAEDRA